MFFTTISCSCSLSVCYIQHIITTLPCCLTAFSDEKPLFCETNTAFLFNQTSLAKTEILPLRTQGLLVDQRLDQIKEVVDQKLLSSVR